MNRRALLTGLLALLPGVAAAREWTCRRWTTREQFGFYTPPTRSTVTVTVKYMDEDPPEMRTQACRGGAGCALERAEDGAWVLMVPRPVDFADERALYILGHELLHALGAQHG
jgi:hypothetical protein